MKITIRPAWAIGLITAAMLPADSIWAQTSDHETGGATKPAASAEQSPQADRPSILLADADVHPTVTISWTTADGERIVHTGSRPYGTDSGREPLGDNIEAFVALGGNRLTKGAGHPKGLIVRAGFYKSDSQKPFFRGAAEDTVIEVRLEGVRCNQPIDVNPMSGVQHLKYSPTDLETCGLPPGAREQFNIADPRDTLNGRTIPGTNARLGILDGSEESLGSITLTERENGLVDMVARFGYPALRNLQDPWESTLPGTFLEPIHFHIEFELLIEGETPLEPFPPERLDEVNRADPN